MLSLEVLDCEVVPESDWVSPECLMFRCSSSSGKFIPNSSLGEGNSGGGESGGGGRPTLISFSLSLTDSSLADMVSDGGGGKDTTDDCFSILLKHFTYFISLFSTFLYPV